jgi:hypothetical protein
MPAPVADLDNPTSERSGPLPDGDVASCVEGYTPEAIAHRAFAFDGVVVDIGPAHSNRSGEGYFRWPSWESHSQFASGSPVVRDQTSQ